MKWLYMFSFQHFHLSRKHTFGFGLRNDKNKIKSEAFQPDKRRVREGKAKKTNKLLKYIRVLLTEYELLLLLEVIDDQQFLYGSMGSFFIPSKAQIHLSKLY